MNCEIPHPDLARRVERIVEENNAYDDVDSFVHAALEDKLADAENGETDTATPSPTKTAESVEKAHEILTYQRDETVTHRLTLPSALWAQLHLKKDDDLELDEYIERLINIALVELTRRESITAEADVELDEETWESLRLDMAYYMQSSDKDAREAFWETAMDHIQTRANIIVNGEPVGPQDIAPRADFDETDD